MAGSLREIKAIQTIDLSSNEITHYGIEFIVNNGLIFLDKNKVM